MPSRSWTAERQDLLQNVGLQTRSRKTSANIEPCSASAIAFHLREAFLWRPAPIAFRLSTCCSKLRMVVLSSSRQNSAHLVPSTLDARIPACGSSPQTVGTRSCRHPKPLCKCRLSGSTTACSNSNVLGNQVPDVSPLGSSKRCLQGRSKLTLCPLIAPGRCCERWTTPLSWSVRSVDPASNSGRRARLPQASWENGELEQPNAPSETEGPGWVNALLKVGRPLQRRWTDQ